MALVGIVVTLTGGALVTWAARMTPGLRRTRGERVALLAGVGLAAVGVATAALGT